MSNKKQVTWEDSVSLDEKYKELYDKIENSIKPLTVSEFNASKPVTFESLQKSSNSLREELEEMTRKKKAIDETYNVPSAGLRKKHDQLLSEIKETRQTQRITWRDIISKVDVQKFLDQYFPRSELISVSDFINTLEFEYPNLLDEYLKEELTEILSVDKEKQNISLNALELFTRERGLELSLRDLKYQLEDRLKQSKKELNENIWQELNDIKNMLDLKTRELDERENTLYNRELDIEDRESSMLKYLEESTQKMASDMIQKGKQELSTQMKRLKALERNVSEMLKLTRARHNSLAKSQSKPDPPSNKLRSRIAGLEKSNEHLKEKLAQFEVESKSDKAIINKLTDELTRLKARNSMLEQSVTYKPKPPSPVKIEVPVEAPKVDHSEVPLAIECLNTVFTSIRVTLPIYNAPGSPRSIISRKSIDYNENPGSLGEILFPSFNTLVPQLAELIPYIKKHKNSDCQLNLIGGFWEILIYAWNAPGDRSILPSNLELLPSTQAWKKGSSKSHKSSQPLYGLFGNAKIHSTLVFYLNKFIKKKNLRLSLTACMLCLLLSYSKKNLRSSLEFIKDAIAEKQEFAQQILLADLNGSVVVFLNLLEEGNDISVLASEVLLTMTMDSIHYHSFISQCVGEVAAKCFASACKKAIGIGIRQGTTSELEANLVILLQKLSSIDIAGPMLKTLGLVELVGQRISKTVSDEFLMTNLNSILRNLS